MGGINFSNNMMAAAASFNKGQDVSRDSDSAEKANRARVARTENVIKKEQVKQEQKAGNMQKGVMA